MIQNLVLQSLVARCRRKNMTHTSCWLSVPARVCVKCDAVLSYLDRGCASRRVVSCFSVHRAAGRQCLHVQWLLRAGPHSYPSQVCRHITDCVTKQHAFDSNQWPIGIHAVPSWRSLPSGLVLYDHVWLAAHAMYDSSNVIIWALKDLTSTPMNSGMDALIGQSEQFHHGWS